jgi:hypothetical protein
MAKLTTKARNKLPASAFALPGRKYPENDPAHAKTAEARATQMKAKGMLSSSDAAKVMSKAKRVLRTK